MSSTKIPKWFICVLIIFSAVYQNRVLQASEGGSVYIISEPPGAVIFLDGNRIAKSNFIIDEVPPGPHKITLELSGYEKSEKTVDIKTGLTTAVQIRLKPVPIGSREYPKKLKVLKDQNRFPSRRSLSLYRNYARKR